MGFIGRNLIEEFRQKNNYDQITVIDDYSNASKIPIDKRSLNIINSDYNKKKTVNVVKNIPGKKIFYFLAGETRVADSLKRPIDFVKANILKPCEFVASACSEKDKFILITTAGALFDGKSIIKEKSIPNPKNVYGATKLSEEIMLSKLCEQKNINFCKVRMTNVYGIFSDRKKSAIHDFTRKILKNEKLIINGDGEQKRDFIYSKDVANIIYNAAISKTSFDKTIYAASGKSYSINEVITYLSALTKMSVKVAYKKSLKLIKTEPRVISVDKKIINRKIKSVSLNQGLKETINFYVKYGKDY